MTEPTLRILVTPDTVDQGFTAKCVDMPGCMSQGETDIEALANLVSAMQLWKQHTMSKSDG